MRVMGIDWGSVRIGAAMSDEDQNMAFPLQQAIETKKGASEIRKLVEEYGVEKIIMGLPLSLKGEETESTVKTKKFAEDLKKGSGVAVEFVDERFSTVQSTKALHQQQIKEHEQREIKDNIAAALMLQQYLDSKNKH